MSMEHWTILGSLAAVLGFIYAMLCNFKNTMLKSFEEQGKKIDALSGKICRIEDRINDLDKRLFGIESVLHMKECCMLKDDRHLKQAE